MIRETMNGMTMRARAVWFVGTLASCGGAPTSTDAQPAKQAASPGEPPAPVTAPTRTETVPIAAPTPVAVAASTEAVTPPTEPAPVAIAEPPAPSEGPPPACAPQVPATASLAERLDLFKAACGDVLLVRRNGGLYATTIDGHTIVRITDSAVRYVNVRRDGDARELYFFAAAAPDLVRLDLRTGEQKVLVSLPRLTHSCFASDGQADPIDFVQSASRVNLDVAGGVLCLNVGDRNDNMASIELNFRADLKTGKVEQTTVFAGNDCKADAGKAREAACKAWSSNAASRQKIAEIDQDGLISPSGRWAFYTDDKFQEVADYVYTSAFLRDTKEHRSYALTPTGLVKIDYAKRNASKGPPEGTCMLPGEATPKWSPDHDILVVDSCGDASGLLVEPPKGVYPLESGDVTFYP